MSTQRRFLAYCDKLFTPSESFIPRGYSAFSKLKPVYVGHELKGPVPEGAEVIELGPLHGAGGEAAYKQLGTISAKLQNVLEEIEPVAIHASFGKSGAYALPLAERLNLPLAVTYYGGDATKTTNTKDSFVRVYNRRRAKLWREADLILPCSKFIRDELAGKGAPTDKMVVHHNTADPSRFEPGEKKDLLVFAGRWTEKKGIDTLIAALARLGDELKGWTIRLIGDGDLKEELVARLEAAGVKAELPGWVPADEMPKHWAEARIAVVPSKRAKSGDAEGLPLVCIEAMLSGCALAATRHAGIPECVKDGETGYLVDEGDDAALADRLARMLSDRERTARMGEAGRAFAMESFNLQTQSRKLESYLIDLAVKAGTMQASDL
ncbi:glycosyltransferase [Henriciella barbarensis]|uniref:Glycosyltransferase n=1 Tax=Henriciella barbarensis TaxID=86342 RepID=A0A399R0E5_9PROT|nr:glycosyltransferase [Henriciella barbarensis]RIJ23944.1 glycosyltransferase [Henriciella barbarensis]